MDISPKFLLPPPNFDKKPLTRSKTHYLTPSGMTLLPRDKQPPPMYGPRGATVPGKHLQQLVPQNPFTAKYSPALPAQPQRQYCEPCEMELQSPEDFRRHRAAHECCPVDGCQYRGHASVMDKHVAAVHASGLYDKFTKMSTPEEIAAWREERRKKYPSVANVQMRQAAQEQRQRRGERLEPKTSRFGKREDRKRTRDGNTNKNTEEGGEASCNVEPQQKTETGLPRGKGKNDRRAKKRRKMQQTNEKPEPKKPEVKHELSISEEVETCGGVCMFRGTSKLKDYRHIKVKPEVATNALTVMLGMYGSDDDEDQSENEEDGRQMDNVENAAEMENLKNPGKIHENKIFKLEEVSLLSSELNDKDVKSNSHSDDLLEKHIKVNLNKTQKLSTTSEFLNEIQHNISSDNEAPDEAPISHRGDFPDNVPKSIPVATIDEPMQKSTKPQATTTKKLPQSQIKRKSGLDYRKARVRKQNTMLEKLLESDIRHERNVLLQCVRYVCENGFFGVGATSVTKSKLN